MRMARWRLRRTVLAWAAAVLPDPRLERLAAALAAKAHRAAASACLGSWRALCEQRRTLEEAVTKFRAASAARQLVAGFCAWRALVEARMCAASNDYS